MSNLDLRATVTAVDHASPVLANVATGAEKMGKSAEQAGQQATRSFKEMEKAGRDVGKGIAGLGVAFILASRSMQDQARQIDAINRLYGDSADAILQQAEAIQQSTNFSNDAARQAAITGASLAQNYGITADQIAVLIERSADLAQIHNIDLDDAMKRVEGAIRGEGEAAELLGLNMSDSATAVAAHAAGLTGWTTTMTEAEKAAFRYQLVIQQTTQTQGAAADAADTTRGRIRDVADTVQDAAQGFADWTGPIGEATAALSDNALEIVLVGASLAKLASGLKEAGAFSKVASLALGPGGLVVAAGAAVAGLIALTDAMGTSYEEAADQAAAATEQLSDAIAQLAQAGSPRATLGEAWKKSFEDSIAPLMTIAAQLEKIKVDQTTIGRQPVASQADADARNKVLDQLDAEEARLRALADQYGGTTAMVQEFAQTEAALAEIIADQGPGAQRVLEIQQGFKDAYDAGRISLKQYMDLTQFLASSLGLYDEAAIRAAGSTDRVAQSSKAAALEQERLADAAKRSADRWKEYDTAIRSARQADADKAKAQRELLASMDPDKVAEADRLAKDTQKWNEYDAAVRKAYDTRVQSTKAAADQAAKLEQERAVVAGVMAATGDLAAGQEAWTAAQETARAAMFDMADAQQAFAAVEKTALGIQTATIDAVHGEVEAYHAATAAVLDYAQSLGVMDSLAERLRPIDLAPRGGDRATGHAAVIEQLGGALDSVLGTFQTIDALGKRAESAGSIAENLVGTPGELATIDDLLKRGVISQTRYNETVEAGYRIQQRQKSVEEDLNVIRAKQLPLLNEADKAYQREIDTIAHMSAEQQTAALGFLDTGEAMKAQQAIALVASEDMRSLGKAGEEATTRILQGATDADPVLREMLESIGLITTDKEGTIHVNFPEGETIQDTLDELDDTLGTLTDTLWEIFLAGDASGAQGAITDTSGLLDGVTGRDWTVYIGGDGSGASTAAATVKGDLEGVTNRDWTVYINSAGDALGNAQFLSSVLDGLDGRSVTSYLNTVTTNTYNEVRNVIGTVGGGSRDGGVIGYADGGVVAELAEVGPERLRFRNGGTAIVAERGFYAVERGTYVTPTAGTMANMGRGGVNLTVNVGEVNGLAGVEEFASALAGAVQRRWASLGM